MWLTAARVAVLRAFALYQVDHLEEAFIAQLPLTIVIDHGIN